MSTITVVFLVLVLSVLLFIQHPKFGKIPTGERLKRIKLSPNYKNNSFQNLVHTPSLTAGVTVWTVIKEFYFHKKPRLFPSESLPSIKTDLHTLSLDQNVLVWFGHSSYFLQVDGTRILVDPVFSGSASPLPFGMKAFAGTDIYNPSDMPEIDLLLISHDHWDHLDYKTITTLKPKIGKVICGLGVGQHLEHWGYDASIIIEKDWNEEVHFGNEIQIHTQSARHFSGRGFLRNKALWLSFVLKTPNFNIFIGGDSGYDDHFAQVGSKFGPFDLAIIENGQYDRKWESIHLMPTDFPKVIKQINAKRILPVHSGKFALSSHPWDEPLDKAIKNNKTNDVQIITPIIGELVNLNDENQAFEYWWGPIN